MVERQGCVTSRVPTRVTSISGSVLVVSVVGSHLGADEAVPGPGRVSHGSLLRSRPEWIDGSSDWSRSPSFTPDIL